MVSSQKSLGGRKNPEIIENRIVLVREFLDEYGPDYLYVLSSGGKDSIAAWAIVNDTTRDYVVVYIHIPGQTHVDNINTVYRVADKLDVKDRIKIVVRETRKIRSQLGEAIDSCNKPCLLHVLAFTHRGEDFWKAMQRYGYPAPLGRWGKGTRWCCGTFKHRVFNRLPYNGMRNGIPWKYGVDGSKATDSNYRRKIYTNDIMTWEKTRDTYLLVLRTLTDQQVWNILRYYNLYEIVHEQYAKWGRAPNCTFCPMLSKNRIMRAVRSMDEAQKRFIVSALKPLLDKYEPRTFSHRSIKTWLEILGDGL